MLVRLLAYQGESSAAKSWQHRGATPAAQGRVGAMARGDYLQEAREGREDDGHRALGDNTLGKGKRGVS